MSPTHIDLTEEQQAKIDLIGMRNIRLTKSIYYKDRFFIADETMVKRTLCLRQRERTESPFACFRTFEEAILAMLDRSGEYRWE